MRKIALSLPLSIIALAMPLLAHADVSQTTIDYNLALTGEPLQTLGLGLSGTLTSVSVWVNRTSGTAAIGFILDGCQRDNPFACPIQINLSTGTLVASTSPSEKTMTAGNVALDPTLIYYLEPTSLGSTIHWWGSSANTFPNGYALNGATGQSLAPSPSDFAFILAGVKYSSGSLASIVDNSSDTFTTATGFTPSSVVSFGGSQLELVLGSGLGYLESILGWIVALVFISAGVYFLYRGYRLWRL